MNQTTLYSRALRAHSFRERNFSGSKAAEKMDLFFLVREREFCEAEITPKKEVG